jgi:hypothetical protein
MGEVYSKAICLINISVSQVKITENNMAFEKGNNLGNGRPKGSENKSTKLTKELLQSVLDSNTEKLMLEMEKLEGRSFIDMYLRIADFILPKQQRINPDELDIEKNIPINVIPDITLEVVDGRIK